MPGSPQLNTGPGSYTRPADGYPAGGYPEGEMQTEAVRRTLPGGRGEGAAAGRSPAKPGRPANRLSQVQVEALYGVYLCGTIELGRPWPVEEIAELWWLPLGYPDAGSAEEGVRLAFKRRGLRLRDGGFAPPPELEELLEGATG